jgi:predicted ATPase
MPPWEEIYISDQERYESFEQALAIYNHLKKAYLELGYDLIEIPTGTIEQRVSFLLEHI